MARVRVVRIGQDGWLGGKKVRGGGVVRAGDAEVAGAAVEGKGEWVVDASERTSSRMKLSERAMNVRVRRVRARSLAQRRTASCAEIAGVVEEGVVVRSHDRG